MGGLVVPTAPIVFFFFFRCRSWQMMLVRGLAERWSEPGGGSWMGAEVFGVDEG